VWFATGGGVFRYDGTAFANFYEAQGLESPGVQDTYQDREGRLWAGGYLGLCRLEGDAFVHVGRDGPW